MVVKVRSKLMTRGLIFDYGGTLDTRGCHWGKVLWHAYTGSEAPVSEENFRQAYVYAERKLATNRIILPHFTFRQTLGEKIRLQIEWLAAQQLLPAGYDTAALHEAILQRAYGVALDSTQEAAEVLAALKQDHPMVLVSNFYGNIASVLREFHLDGLFGSIIESAVVGIRKPDPRIFLLGAERLGMDVADITVVGDSYDKDIMPAHQAGFTTVWLKGEGWTDEEPQNPVADRIIGSLKEML